MNQQLTTRDSAMRNSITSRGSLNEPGFQMEALKTEKARRSLKAFVIQAWPILEPNTEFVEGIHIDRKSTRLNSSHLGISYAVFCEKATAAPVFPYTTHFRSGEGQAQLESIRDPGLADSGTEH